MNAQASPRVPVLEKISSDKVFCYVSMALLVFLPVAEIIQEFLKASKLKAFRYWYPSYFQPYIVEVFGIALTALVIVSFIARATSGKFRLYAADVFYFTLMLFMLLSMIFSVDFGVFAEGQEFYMEHPLHFLCYYGLFYAGTMIEDPGLRKRLLYSYVIIAVIEGIVAFLQTRGIEITYCLFSSNKPSYTASYGTLQNTNFFGTLSCILTAACSGLFIFSSKLIRKKALKWAVFAVTLLIFYTMLESGARLTWVGMIAMILMYIVSLIVMRKGNISKDTLKQITVDFLTMIIGYVAIIIVMLITDYSYVSERIEQTANDTVVAIGSDDFGSGRGEIWRAALHSVPNHWVTGIGLDNLGRAFKEMPGWQKGMYIQSKGHSEYIHTLATQGVFAIINYIALLIYAGVGSVKIIFREKNDVKRSLLWVFFAVFTAYIAQAVVSSSIMNVAPYFWIVLGIVTPRENALSFKRR